MGSVKDLVVIKAPVPKEMGEGIFTFSDRYSVFDWGEMPDHIPYKGESLCCTTEYFFREFEKAGMKTHYIKDEEANQMRVFLVDVIRPLKKVLHGSIEYDYSAFQNPQLANYLIPLEVIYRNGLPEGSSVFKRIKKGELKPEDLGLNHMPYAGQILPEPYFDVSTKLEDGDRYLGWKGACDISGLNERELKEIQDYVKCANKIITDSAAHAGLTNWDGKFEFAFDTKRNLMFVDAVGTLDECRFTYNGCHVSKEILRQYYKKTQPEWIKQIEDAKATKKPKWKNIVTEKPKNLPPSLRDIVSNLYMAAANGITQQNVFSTPEMNEAINEYKKFMGSIHE